MKDSIQLVKSLYAAFARGDLEAIYAACDPNVSWYSNSDPAIIPWGGERKGIDSVRAFFGALAGNIDFETFEPQQFLGGPDVVVVIGHSVARAKASGGRIEDEWRHVHWVRNGKVVQFREYADSHAVVQGFRGLGMEAGARTAAEARRPH